MATEVEKAASFPQYPELILEAIGALDSKEGANKSAISKYIESKFGEVPAGHASLLSSHLARMKDDGELVFFKNNYLLPDPTAPPRRGRGRPPKPKDPAAESAEKLAPPTSPRGRGRPRKDPNAEPTPKKPKPAADDSSVTPETGSKTGRPRGRPRKVIQSPAAADPAAVVPNGGV